MKALIVNCTLKPIPEAKPIPAPPSE